MQLFRTIDTNLKPHLANMAASYQLLTLIAVLQLVASSPAQANTVVYASNSSLINRILPSFATNPFRDLRNWFEGISSIFPTPVFPKTEEINGTKVWSIELDVASFNSSQLNVTRRGLALQVLGKQTHKNNQTREMLYQQSVPPNGELKKLQAVLKDHTLKIALPLREEETVVIPIKVDSDLKFKAEVKTD